jgi:endogenous inhibitor of DNA gyrase (YacG/DUF329 family)
MTSRCPICGREFKRTCDAKRHYRVEHMREPTRCPACGKDFINERAMMSHLFQTALLDDLHAMYFYLNVSNIVKGETSRIVRRRGRIFLATASASAGGLK